MSKVGRNDKCPCGSGKKYKHCCLNANPMEKLAKEDPAKFMKELNRRMEENAAFDASVLFNRYNSIELIAILSLLQVLPQNHGKNIRLEELQRQAVLSINQNRSPVDVQELKTFIHTNLPHHYLEDPPENLFTQNLMTAFGNFIIFPGITDGQDYYLHNMVIALNENISRYPEAFIREALGAVFLLMALSDIVARRLGYQRNEGSIDLEDDHIFVPDVEFIEKYKYEFMFPNDQMERLCRDLGTELKIIENYLIDLDDPQLQVPDSDISPLVYKPILRLKQGYVLISPTAHIFAATNTLLAKAIEHNCLSSFLKDYASICWSQNNFLLDELGFTKLEFEFPETSLPIFEGVYRFDTDKLAYVVFEYDNGEAYDIKYPLKQFSNDKLSKEIQKRKSDIGERIVTDPRSENFRFFNINLFLGIGRRKMSLAAPPSKVWESLVLMAQDLNVLYGSGKCNNLTLWNYAIAVKTAKLHTPFFLDNISYFLANENSFYSTDQKIGMLQIVVGNSSIMRAEAIRNLDEHLAEFPGEPFQHIPVTREKLPALLDIYSTRRIPVPFKVYTPVLGKDVWIIPTQGFDEPEGQKQKFDSEVCIAIAYWFSEMATDLRPLINISGLKPLVFKIDTVEVINASTAFENINPEADPLTAITVTIKNNEIAFHLNELFYYNLYRTDNHGERILMEKVLKAMHDLTVQQSANSSLTKALISELIHKHMPLGFKKKLLVQILDGDFRLQSENIMGVRLVQKFHVNRQLDGLAEKLSEPPYQARIFSDEEKINVINSGVHLFYTELRKCLEGFSFVNVLKKLLALHESAIQKRENFKLEITPRILCFKEHCDIFKFISEENSENVNLSLSLRCLIEHIVAEPPEGDTPFDVESLDSALAYMYNIINWGFVSDELRFKIANPEVSFLESGRVGISKEFSNETIVAFYEEKFSEDVRDSKEAFEKRFKNLEPEKKKEENLETEIDKPFPEEFGISVDDFYLISECAIHEALERDKSVYSGLKEGFVKQVNTKTNVSNETIEKFLALFSIFNRGKVENVAELGFKNEDFYPWRYNRGLSLLNKPFILINLDQHELIWFGSRAVYDFREYIINSIYSGRLKAKSQEMKSIISTINNRKGKEFNKKVHAYLKQSGNFSYVEQSVPIRPGAILESAKDLGDIDVLVVSDKLRKVFAIECKNTNTSRTPYEMNVELMSFKDKWIPKVDKRKQWLNENKALLNKLTKSGLSDFDFEYLFLTEEVIPIGFLKEHNVLYRFIPYFALEKSLEKSLFEIKPENK